MNPLFLSLSTQSMHLESKCVSVVRAHSERISQGMHDLSQQHIVPLQLASTFLEMCSQLQKCYENSRQDNGEVRLLRKAFGTARLWSWALNIYKLQIKSINYEEINLLSGQLHLYTNLKARLELKISSSSELYTSTTQHRQRRPCSCLLLLLPPFLY